ncbi:unnamed protein product [Rotaria sp. Silwood2]|nr:unnamed protein product [Rotaria sp. Silwood2]CAF3106740.1 unnamed protein product [Rotaria sp. Silwood2]CAF3222751.1 unnamed protein product [Rotaria sp. Silwood2]CAF4525507.1 unnamed protein product [Rotaria sp. Silwood2]CAF4542190.1 unnamed protein product [Rotaria sp. Silwood2]
MIIRSNYFLSILANWADYMETPTTSGSVGQAQVGISTLATIMASWLIPEEFRTRAVDNVKILIAAASVGSYMAQAFTFNTETGALLTTLLIVVKKLDSPTNSDLPVAATYITITTNAGIKKLYTVYYTDRCFRCGDCIYMWECCCKRDNANYIQRGNTPEELNIIKQKMTADQFVWFNERTLSNIVKRSFSYNDNNPGNGLTEAIEKHLSNNIVKGEVLKSYNDSILTALQSNITSLKLSSQTLKLEKVERQNVATLLISLANDYGFDNISSSPQFLQQSRFSYENLYTSKTDNRDIFIKYIWILGQNLDNLTYTINFLYLNITARSLIETLLYNNAGQSEQVNIVRTSILADSGEFLSEQLSTLITPWKLKTTNIALNILRYIGASVFVPQKYRMLSYFNPKIVSPETNSYGISNLEARFADKIVALAQAVSAVANAWKDVVSAFKSSSSTTITRITRLGFNYFHQKTEVLKVIDIPADKVNEFINALIFDYNLPSKTSFKLGLTYSDDFAWDRVEYLYSPTMNGSYNSVTMFKNGDSIKNTGSFFIIDIESNWQLAPDLLLIRESKSILGGIWEETKESIQEVPHMLTMEEAVLLQKFFMVIATGNLAGSLGVNVTYPQLT